MSVDIARLLTVANRTVGDSLAVVHASGVGVLEFENGYAFSEAGGEVAVIADDGTETVYVYSSMDDDASTLALVGTTSAAYSAGQRLEPRPAQPFKFAQVRFGADGEAEDAIATHDLQGYEALGEGQREEDEIDVEVEYRRGTLRIINVINRQPGIDAGTLVGTVPPAALTDGNPPIDAPVVTASPFAIAAVEAEWDPLDPVDNPDPNEFLVHASLTSPVPEDGSAYVYTTKSTVARVSAVGGAPLPAGVATEVFIKIQSADADGLGPFSGEVSATTLTADGFITAEWIAAIAISAQQIITGKFSAGQALFGDFIEVDGDMSSITIYGDADHLVPLIQLRPEGSVFRGQVIADDISVMQGLILQGIASQIAQGAGVTLMSGVASPATAPTLTAVTTQQTWPAVPAGYDERGIGWDATASRWLRLLTPKTGTKAGTCRVQRITAAGAYDSEITLANVPSVTEWAFNSICRMGSSYYTCVKDDIGGWSVVKFSTAGAYQARDFGIGYDPKGAPAIGTNTADTELWIVSSTSDPSIGDKLVLERLDASLVFIGGVLNIDWPTSRADDFTYVELATFDLGSRLVYSAGGSVYSAEYVASVWTEQSDETFALSAVAYPAGGVGHNGSNFFSTHGAGVLHKYSSYYPSASQKAYVDHADTGSGDITRPSPVANLAIPARRYLQVSLPPGGASSSDVFMGLGTTQPSDSAMLKRAEALIDRNMLIDPTVAGGAAHSSLRTLSAVTRSGTVATGTTSAAHGYTVGDQIEVKGAAAPLSGIFVIDTVPDTTHFTYAVPNSGSTSSAGTVIANTFGAGSPGWFKSAVGGLALYGDGKAEVARAPTDPVDVVNKAALDAAIAERQRAAINVAVPSGTGGVNVNVTFSSPMVSTPSVQVTKNHPDLDDERVTAKSTSGCTIRLDRAASGTYTVDYIASLVS